MSNNNGINADIVGQRFGRLVVVKNVSGSKYLFRCDCGNEIVTYLSAVKNGYQRSCGCLWDERKKAFGESVKKHGGYGTNLYSRYCAIKQRCYNPNNQAYHRYGGRGIVMCDEWKNSFESFRKWAYENGYENRKSLSIDRIDNDGDYSPDNCRFVDAQQQSLNRERTVLCEYNGKEYSSWGFAKEFGISSSFVYKRLKNGISPEHILSEWDKTNNTPDYLITLEEAAKRYNKTEGHIRRMLNQGKLKGERINWKWYVCKEQ